LLNDEKRIYHWEQSLTAMRIALQLFSESKDRERKRKMQEAQELLVRLLHRR
jgi:hypothetical protein